MPAFFFAVRLFPQGEKRECALTPHEISTMVPGIAGEIGPRPAPKEQPPRKLSGKRTAIRSETLESRPE